MSRRNPPRLLSVLRKVHVSPNMLRVTFGGDALHDFPLGSESANVKLLLPQRNQDWHGYLQSLEGKGDKPLKRTYTVLQFRQAESELDIEIALHNNAGPATRWAINAQAGDQIAVAGPGSTRLLDFDAEWFLLAGDMSALPAIITNINQLPATAKGHIIIEVQAAADQRNLELPADMRLQWLTNAEPGSPQQPLVKAVKALCWLDGTPSVWIAGESDNVRALRAHLLHDKKLSREHRYTSGYWKVGETEDSFQPIKRSEVDE